LEEVGKEELGLFTKFHQANKALIFYYGIPFTQKGAAFGTSFFTRIKGIGGIKFFPKGGSLVGLLLKPKNWGGLRRKVLILPQAKVRSLTTRGGWV